MDSLISKGILALISEVQILNVDSEFVQLGEVLNISEIEFNNCFSVVFSFESWRQRTASNSLMPVISKSPVEFLLYILEICLVFATVAALTRNVQTTKICSLGSFSSTSK